MGKKNKYRTDEKTDARAQQLTGQASGSNTPSTSNPQVQKDTQQHRQAQGGSHANQGHSSGVPSGPGPSQQQNQGSQDRSGYQQRGDQGGRSQGGGYQQRGPQGGQSQGGGYQQRGDQGGRSQGGGYQQRGDQGGRSQGGGYQQRGDQGGRSQGGGYQQRGPQGGQSQGGGYQQRGDQGGRSQGGSYQQRGHTGASLSLPPQPPGSIKRGTIGKCGQVAVNYLEVDMSKMPSIAYHYDVSITPERPKKFFRNAFEQFRINHLKNTIAAFDGRASCYLVDKLETDNTGGDVKVTDAHGRTLNYNVQIKKTSGGPIQLDSLKSYMKDKIYDKPMQAMQCLEVVLAAPCHKKAIRSGRSFFKMSEPNQRRELGDGYECLVGLYQSFILGDRPFVNVDISHKSFPIALTVLEYIERYGINPRGASAITKTTNLQPLRSNIEHFLKGINIIYEPPQSFNSAPRVFKVNGLSPESAERQTFEMEDKKTMTIKEYFRSRNYNLKYPNLHCLQAHGGKLGSNIYLPMELCRIEEGQSLNRKDGTNQVAAMIKFAATSTNDRKAKIVNLLNYMQHNLDPTISRFGFSINNDFITVLSRILDPPRVEYKNKSMSMVRNGSWRMDQRAQFLELQPKVHKWAILQSDGNRKISHNQVVEFGNMFRNQGLMLNVILAEKPDIRTFTDDRNLDACFDDLKRNKFDLVIVIIPSYGTSYDTIKQKAELTHGILTQCIKQVTVERKLNPQLIGNLLLKVNSKLNGINHKLKDDPLTTIANVMFLGADVTHPSPDQREIPSVVGVAASHDLYGGAYNMQYRLQDSRKEEIEDMEGIVREHLRIYQQYRKKYPDHIVYYRDGVSDGQFPKIKQLELRGINAACAKLKINPKLCCAIVVKRHHTRFFPEGVPSQYNKFNNVEPGTVVDRTIVHPNEMQFFMVSHQSIQGTAKPTRYNIIENTGNLDIDLLQQLTYNLCHMFPRCTRSVSYPAPAYLAHLVAARGRVYLTGTRTFKSPKEEYKTRLINADFMKSNPMYFV